LANDLTAEDLDRFKSFVRSVRWQTAKAVRNPHQYTIRWWHPDQDLDWIYRTILRHGYKYLFWNVVYTCLDVDGYMYWGMNAPIEERYVLNRRPCDDCTRTDLGHLGRRLP